MVRCRVRGVVCLAAVFVAALPGIALAAASLSGRVSDGLGAALPGVHVTATQVETNVSYAAVTNADGVYLISSLPSGRYRISVELSGFKTIVKPDVDIHVQDNVALNFTMEVGSIIESVTVEGGTPLVSMNPAVGTLVNRSFVENLPLNGRSFQSLIALTPGVLLTKTSGVEQGQFSANGQRADANYFTVDGVSANIGVTAGAILGQGGGGAIPGLTAAGGTNNLVSIDALEEFRIETSNYAPEYGRTSGAQVALVTRAGTNQFHGAAFDYIRNDALDANDWFANNRGLPKPVLRQHDFGGVVGGPVLRNQLFFFFSYEGLRLRRPQVSIVNVPSLAIRAGAVPSVRPLLDAYPLPTGPAQPNGQAEFAASYSNPSSLDATSLRLDFARSASARFFGRVNLAPSNDVSRTDSLNSRRTFEVRTKTVTLGSSLLAGSRTTVDVHGNVSANQTFSDIALDDFGGAKPPPPTFLIPSSAPLARSGYSTSLLTGELPLQYGVQSANDQNQVNLVANATHLIGNHLLKAGVDYRRLFPTFSPQQYTIAPLFSSLEQFQRGVSDFFFVGAEDGSRYPIFSNYSAFAQDAWAMSPRLTVTYGVRWDYNAPAYEAHGRNPILADTQDLSAVHLRPATSALYDAARNNVAPRVGIAYRLDRGAGRETVLRGGLGVFYDLGVGRIADVFTYGVYPYASQRISSGISIPPSPTAAAPLPFDQTTPADAAVYSVPQLFVTPRTYQWNVSVERAIGRSNTLTVSYVGNEGRRLLRMSTLLRPTPQFNQVFVFGNEGRSDYRALQVQFKRRMSHGFEGLASYTWSRARDNASADSAYELTPPGLAGADVDYGAANFDVRHAATGAFTWNVPGSAASNMLGAISRQWSLDGVVTTRSATPLNPRSRIVSTGYRIFVRPDIVPNVPWYLEDDSYPGGKRINPAAFSVAPLGRQGTLPRNTLRGFGMFQLDAALRRSFNLPMRSRLQLKIEAFNVLNHPNFANPADTTITNPTFGLSTSMLAQGLFSGGGTTGGFSPLYQIGGPRSLQLSLRVSF